MQRSTNPTSKRYYIGNGGREEKAKTSVITILSVIDHRKIADIAIDGDNIEAMAVDHTHHPLFVNIRDKKEIGVVDLTSNTAVPRLVSSCPSFSSRFAALCASVRNHGR
jgi:hypothetical protein